MMVKLSDMISIVSYWFIFSAPSFSKEMRRRTGGTTRTAPTRWWKTWRILCPTSPWFPLHLLKRLVSVLQFVELVMACFFCRVSPTGVHIEDTSKLLWSSNLCVEQSSFTMEYLFLLHTCHFLLQRNQLTSLASHQKW